MEANRDKVRVVRRETSLNAAAVFLSLLEGLVYSIGGAFTLFGLYAAFRWYNGQTIPFLSAFNSAFNPDYSSSDMENTAMRRMAITPDVIRT